MADYTVTLTADQELGLDYYLEQQITPDSRENVIQAFVTNGLAPTVASLESKARDVLDTVAPLEASVRTIVLDAFHSDALRTRVTQLLPE